MGSGILKTASVIPAKAGILRRRGVSAFAGTTLALLSSFPALANEESGGLPQFKSEWFPSQIFWLAVTFAVLYLFFSRRALPRIESAMAGRQRAIQGDLDAAADLSARAKTIRDGYERNMAQAKDRAADAIRQADSQLKSKMTDMLYSYRTKFTQEVARAETELTAIRARLHVDMQNVSAEIAAHAASEILQTAVGMAEAQGIVVQLTEGKRAA